MRKCLQFVHEINEVQSEAEEGESANSPQKETHFIHIHLFQNSYSKEY